MTQVTPDPAVREAAARVDALNDHDRRTVLAYLAGYVPHTVTHALDELFGAHEESKTG